jgi:hypothetical protein
VDAAYTAATGVCTICFANVAELSELAGEQMLAVLVLKRTAQGMFHKQSGRVQRLKAIEHILQGTYKAHTAVCKLALWQVFCAPM